MKKILLLLIAVAFIALNGCSDKKQLEPCEKDHFGYVKIINDAPFNLWVDATETGGSDYNQETRLWPGTSVTIQVPSGDVTVWGTDDYGYSINSWSTDWVTVSDCQTFKYTWNAKKSASPTQNKTHDKD